MSPRKRNIITGVVVLFALGTLAWMVLTFSGRAVGVFKPVGMPVVFVADRADGLSEGSPVFFKGVSIGKVTSVHRMDDNVHVRIEGEVNSKPPLPHNLIGDISAQSKLGNSTQIDLRLSSKDPEGQMEPGQQIEIRYGAGSLFPPGFSEFIEEANRQQLVKHVDEAIVSMRLQIEKFGKAMESLQSTLGDSGLQSDLKQTMANVRQATERANKVAANLDTLTANANGAVTDVRTTIAKTDKNIDRVARQVGDSLDKLSQSLQEFQRIAAKIDQGKGTAGALVNDPKLYDELTLTAKELNVVAASLARLVDQWEHEGVSLKMGK